MKKPTLPGLLALVTAAGLLAACSGGTNAASGNNNSGGGTLTLASVDQGSIEDVVKAFEAANPGVKVHYTTSGADQYQQQIRTQLASGTAPDVMSVWPGNGNPGATYVLAKPGYLLDLSDQPWASKLPPTVKTVAQYEGKTYNAIFGLNAIGAVYNQQALQQGRAHPAGDLDRAAGLLPGRRRQGHPRVRAGDPGQLGHPAGPVRARRHPRVRLRPRLRQEDAGRPGHLRQLAVDDRAGNTRRWTRPAASRRTPLGTSYEASQDAGRHRQDARHRAGQLGGGTAEGEEPGRHVHPQAAAGQRRPGPGPDARARPAPATGSTPRRRTRSWR